MMVGISHDSSIAFPRLRATVAPRTRIQMWAEPNLGKRAKIVEALLGDAFKLGIPSLKHWHQMHWLPRPEYSAFSTVALDPIAASAEAMGSALKWQEDCILPSPVPHAPSIS